MGILADYGGDDQAASDLWGGLLPFGALAWLGLYLIQKAFRGDKTSDFASPVWSRVFYFVSGLVCVGGFVLFLMFATHQSRAAR